MTMTVDPDLSEALASHLRLRTARVAVLGLGYVGLPLAVAFARAGFAVRGIDVDASKIESLGLVAVTSRTSDTRICARSWTPRLPLPTATMVTRASWVG